MKQRDQILLIAGSTAGGAGLAVLLLLTAGPRRMLGSREAASNRD
jgi:hypothetical protein